MTYKQLSDTLAKRVRKFGLRETARECKLPHSTLQTLMDEEPTRWRQSHLQAIAKGMGYKIEYTLIDTVTGAKQ